MEKRNFGEGSRSIEPRWEELSARISAVVNRLMADRGIGKVELGRRLRYAHSTISNTLNNKQRWSFTLLLLVADELEVTLTDIISAAENGEEGSPWFAFKLEGTESGSCERLNRIIQMVAPSDTAQEVLDLYFNTAMMEMSVPRLVDAYTKGEISDNDMFRKLHKVYDSLEDGENFWVKVSQNEKGLSE